jgi:hypothetical protein
MLGKQKTNILLIVIVAIGFLYRFYLTTMNVFPSGSDIGLHESVINSLLAPKSSLFYNYYHMGGGLSATNPGYHIFAVFIITMTGAPDYLVQAAVASLFSALIIAGAFLVTELVWGELAGFIVAILVTFSASDTIMLSWAGYPNIVALALIPILFYLFLQPAKFSSKNFLGAASIIVAALFLTHLFSALVFLGITIVALSASLLFRRSTGFTVNKAFLWLIPIFFGVLLVAPYLINVLPLYFGSQGAITGTVAVMKQAVVETRVIPTTILCLSIVPLILFPLFSRFQKGKFLSLPTILFASAILVPLAATQSYLLGFYLDYERFLYFLALPAIICVGLVVISSSNIIALGLGRIRKTLKVVSGPVLLSILVIVCLLTPLFALPSEGAAQANFFQVMTPNKYDAIQWAKASTPANATFVADAEFGWWLSGFGQRPTLSAVDPQYLILQHEFGPASVASNMLSADYSIDNGLLQVKQEGAYANGSSHNLYAITNESYIYPLIFSLNDTQISLLYRTGGIPQQTTLGAFTQSNTEVTNNGNSASFLIKRENSSFNIT